MARQRWRAFKKARESARSLRLLDLNEWCSYARGDLRRQKGIRPDDIPTSPMKVCRDEGWRGLRDWLGPPPIEPAVPGFLDFRRSRQYARALGLTSAAEWRRWCEGGRRDLLARPVNVPEDPEAIYVPSAAGRRRVRGAGAGGGVPGT